MAVSVDLVVLTVRSVQLCALVWRRDSEPHRGRWGLPGGFIRLEEDLPATAARILADRAGLPDAPVHLEQLQTYGYPDRDPRQRVLSVAYLGLAPFLPAPDQPRMSWQPVADLTELAFDHARILQDGIERARAKLEYTSLAAAFCGEEFSVAELRRVYEIVWGTPLDPRNFHRKVTGAVGFLVETGSVTSAGGGRPAQLYRRGEADILYPPMLRPVRSLRHPPHLRRSAGSRPRRCRTAGILRYPSLDAGGGWMSVPTPRLRPVLDRFAPYKPGRPPSSASGRSFKLSSNESPFGPLPSVVKVIAEAAADINRYPDNGAAALTQAISDRLAVPPDHIAFGSGSVGVLQQLLEATCDPGTEVVYAWRSFEAYPYLADLAGATSVQVPLRDERHDLDAMVGAITDRTGLIFVCNPNNPTGTTVTRAELERFLDRVPGHCLVAIDEAYVQYVRDLGTPDGTQIYRDRPNVCVLRTFSKAYGLAGLRVGFLIGHPPIAEAVRKTMLTFAVNSIAQAAAVASLAAERELMERVDQVVIERQRVVAALRAIGYRVPDTEGNFVWLRLAGDTMAFAEACDGAGVSVRPFAGEGARITVGEPEANDIFLRAAGAFRGWPPAGPRSRPVSGASRGSPR